MATFVIIHAPNLTVARAIAADPLSSGFIGPESEWSRGSSTFKSAGAFWIIEEIDEDNYRAPDGWVDMAFERGAAIRPHSDLSAICEWAEQQELMATEIANGKSTDQALEVLRIVQRERARNVSLESALATARAEIGGSE